MKRVTSAETHPSGRQVLREHGYSDANVEEIIRRYVVLMKRTYRKLSLFPLQLDAATRKEYKRIIWLCVGFLEFDFDLTRLAKVIEN